MKKSAIAEHLIKSTCFQKSFDTLKFTIMRQYSNTLEILRLEYTLIYLTKPILCKKKELDYT